MVSPAAATVTQGTLSTTSGRALPLDRTAVQAQIAAPFATVVVRQRFRNDSDVPVDAEYAYPLPHDASVYRMQFRIADRIVRGVVKERAEARAAYERARAEGRAATLLEEDQPSLFTLSVANIAPGAVIEVELEYQEILVFDDDRWRFVFPMVAPERYREGGAPTARDRLAPPRLPTGERPADVSIELQLDGEQPIEDLRCITHPVKIEQTRPQSARASLEPLPSLSNRDFVLEWRAAAAGVRPRVRFERSGGQQGTFLLTLLPSAGDAKTEARGGAGEMKALCCGNCGGTVRDMRAVRDLPGVGPVVACAYCGALLAPGTERLTHASRPRDVLVLVDRSASMRGATALAAAAVRTLLEALPAGDAVQAFAFDHDCTVFDPTRGLLAISPESIAAIEQFVRAATPRGGSQLEQALERAAAIAERRDRTRVFVLLTDAAIGNEGRLLRRIPEVTGQSPVFVLGLGPAVDRRIVARLAQVSGGAFDILALGAQQDETMQRFARRVRDAGPVLTDLSIWWSDAAATQVYPSPIPALYAGQPVHLLGRFEGRGDSTLVVTGTTAAGSAFRQELRVSLPEESRDAPGLARLWARQRVSALVESDGARERAEALELSLRHAIVSPLTSLVAEDSQVSVQKKPRPGATLTIVAGPTTGTRFRIERDRIVCGRATGCDLLLADNAVSRNHFEILYDGQLFVLRDLDSVNTTSVNGQNVREARLSGGERIKAGATVLEFALEADAGAPAWIPHVGAAPPPGAAPVAPPGRMSPPGGPPPPPPAYSPPPGFAAPGGFGAPGGFSPAAPPAFAPAASPPLAPGGAPPMPPPPGFASPALEAERDWLRAKLPAHPPGYVPPPFAPAPMAPAPMPPVPMSPAPMPAPGQYGAHVPQMPLQAPGSEPYPERELRFVQQRTRGELDLVFLVDATQSMGPYIQEVKTHLLALIDAVRRSPLCRSLRVGLVSYRDHPPQERTYVTQVTELTDDVAQITSAVGALAAQGGGDGPEAVTDGLHAVVRLGWRPGAAKAVVWCGDAPPHGVEPSGDAFPQGCPCGQQWYAQVESCREMNIAIYAIGCLPEIRKYKNGEGVFRTAARVTRATFLPLRDARLLVPLIAGASESELDKQRVDEYVADAWAEQAELLARTSDFERVRWITEVLRARGVRARSLSSDNTRLEFRELEPSDVEGALDRLRLQGRVAA